MSLSFLFPFDSFLFQHLPFFVIGILVFRFLTEIDNIKIFIVFLIVTLIVICFKYDSSFEYLMAGILPLFFFFLIKNVGKIGEFLGKISNQIINRVKGVNRVVYDISSKPPATIEWE